MRSDNDLSGAIFFIKFMDKEDGKMYSNEEIVAVLQAVYIEHKTKAQTAADYQMHWNTVYNICKKYQYRVKELECVLAEGEEAKRTFTKKIEPRTRKVTEVYQQEIATCCREHLNCQRLKRNPEEYIRNLCAQYDVRFSDIICYCPEHIEIPDGDDDFYKRKRRYFKYIRRIRAYHNGIKNYQEVYELLRSREIFKRIPISFDTFYQYAREYWEDDVLNGHSFGEYVDAMCRKQLK